MKKCMNHSDTFVTDSLEGIYKAYPEVYQPVGENLQALVRTDKEDKVAVVTGGGYGHLPLFLGYVGKGLCDGAAVGNVFTSPSCETILDVSRAVNAGKGILYLFGNYFGDSMNFDMAGELLSMEGIRTEIVRGCDDMASAPRDQREKRRGIAGITFAYKTAGASAARGDSLEKVAETARKTIERTATMGIAFSSCTLPGMDHSIFQMEPDDMEIGMGIHGEPGIRREKMITSCQLAERLFADLIKDLSLKEKDRVAVLVNGLGMTSREELFIFFRDGAKYLEQKGIKISYSLVGEYATSLEMAGLSASILKLDDQLEPLLKSDSYTPFLRF